MNRILLVEDDGSMAKGLAYNLGAEGYDVTVRRTTFGIPHVRAKDFGSLGYGSGYAFAEDNICVLARTVLKVRGEQAEFFGDAPDLVAADFHWRYWASDAQADAFEAAQSEELQTVVEGYSAGLSRFITERGDEAAEDCRGAAWLRPISVLDLYKVYVGLLGLAGGNNFEGDLAYVPPSAIEPYRGAYAERSPIAGHIDTGFVVRDLELGHRKRHAFTTEKEPTRCFDLAAIEHPLVLVVLSRPA